MLFEKISAKPFVSSVAYASIITLSALITTALQWFFKIGESTRGESSLLFFIFLLVTVFFILPATAIRFFFYRKISSKVAVSKKFLTFLTVIESLLLIFTVNAAVSAILTSGGILSLLGISVLFFLQILGISVLIIVVSIAFSVKVRNKFNKIREY